MVIACRAHSTACGVERGRKRKDLEPARHL